MDTNRLPDYSEVLSLHRLKPEQYIAAATQAAMKIGWQVVTVLNNTLICHTQGWNSSLGESVTITVDEENATFTSKSVNEYYWTDNQNKINADLFKESVSEVIKRDREIEKRLNPLTREKYGAFIPSRTYLVTPLLLYLNVLVFLCMVISGISPVTPAVPSLLAWGGNFRPAVMAGDWWRLLTHMFLHGGIIHLLMNMYALLYIGLMLEPLLGKFRFAAAYLITGVCGGLLSITLHAYSVGVGASGAIFGMYGVFLAMLTTKHIEKTARNTMLRSILFFVVFNLLYGMQGNTDNAAHIGGLLSGIVIGYSYFPGISGQSSLKKQLLVTSVILVIVMIVSAFAISRLTNDLPVYEQKMKRFVEIENKGLEVFKIDRIAPKDVILGSITNHGINYWNEDISILQEMETLDLPPQIKARNAQLKQYCYLRIDLLNLIYKQVSNDDASVSDKIKDDEFRIAKILDELRKK